MIYLNVLKKGFLLALFLLISGASHSQSYYAYVTAESEDAVYLVKYDADTQKGSVVDEIKVGQWPTEIEGPHGINIGLDGEYWYLSVAHGNPYGWLYKFKTGSNEFITRTQLGLFPASMEISKATGLLYVVNFNLHGDMEPSTVSVVDPEAMEVIGEITTGIMPHGSRLTEDGRKQYHVSMMTDELMEINAVTMQVSRRLNVVDNNQSRPMKMKSGDGQMMKPECKPTWADPHPTKDLVYIACNGSDVILEVNSESWKVERTFKAGKGSAPYNLEVSHDGKLLVASYKGEGATGVWDLGSGEELANIPNSRKVTHGVSITPDSKFAFMSVEGIGGEPGSVDIIDLNTLKRTDYIEVGKQAGGIIFWKKEK